MKKRIIVTAVITACLALCAAVWPQTEKVEKTPAPSEKTAVTTPRPTFPEAEKPVLPVVTEKKESEMLEAESAPEVATEELPIPVPEIEDEAETEQEYVPPTQTDSIPVQPTQPEPKSAPEPIANDNELADMVYVTGFGWIESQGPNQVEYAEDMAIQSAIDGRLRRMEDYIARSSFTRNVEQDMTNGIIAEAFEMDREDLKRRRA